MTTIGAPLPWVPLLPDESLIHTSALAIVVSGSNERVGRGWITSQRILIRVDQTSTPATTTIINETGSVTPSTVAATSTATNIVLPLSSILTHVVSKPKPGDTSKVLMKLTYQQQPQPITIRFITPETCIQERTVWKDYLVQYQVDHPIATVGSAPTPSTTASTPLVKSEPGLTPTPPVPSHAPTHKRPHSAISSHNSTTASSAAIAASSSVATPAAGVTSDASLNATDLQSLIRARASLLARDPDLQAIHRDLVPNAVSEEEFWQSRAELLRAEQQKQLGGSGGGGSNGIQRAGISSTMASTIRPETGCNVVRYTLDATQIHAIFLENPMVYELYQQLVPDKLDEKAFWTRYFKSQYIHSQSNTTVSNELNKQANEEDLFAKATAMQEAKENEHLGLALNANATDTAAAMELDEKKDMATKAVLLQRKIDPSVDLTSSDLSNAILQSVAAAYSLQHSVHQLDHDSLTTVLVYFLSSFRADPTKSSGSTAPSSNTTRSKKARAQTELLQRFNRHGMLVLDSNLTAPKNSSTQDQSVNETKLQTTYHTSLASSLELIDLSHEVEPTYNQLSIGRSFFQSLGARKSTASAAQTGPETQAAMKAFLNELNDLPIIADPNLTRHTVQHIPASSESRSILFDLTSTARGLNKAAILAKQLREDANQQPQFIVFSTGHEPDMLIPDPFRDELKKRYHTCNELFRHFWSSLHSRTINKLTRVHTALDEQYRLLVLIRESLHQRNYTPLVPLLNPLMNSIEMCTQTYQKFQEKESKKHPSNTGPPRITNVKPEPTNNEQPNKRIKL